MKIMRIVAVIAAASATVSAIGALGRSLCALFLSDAGDHAGTQPPSSLPKGGSAA